MAGRPVYYARLRIGAITCEVRVNDCPVVNQDECVGLVLEEAINEWVHDDRNAIELIVSPCEGEDEFRQDALVEMSIHVKDSVTGQVIHLGGLRLRRGEDPGQLDTGQEGLVVGGVVVPVGGATFRVQWAIELDVPFGKQVWEDGAPLGDPSGLARELEAEMRRLWRLVKAKDTDGLLAFFRARDEDLARVFYGSVEDEIESDRRAIENWWKYEKSPFNMHLEDFYEGDLVVGLYGYGRLARLEIGGLGGSPVYQADKAFSVFNFIGAMFYRHPEKGWIAIR